MDIDLGKYAGPVVAAWGITLVLLAGLVLQSWLAARRAKVDLERAEAAARGPRHG